MTYLFRGQSDAQWQLQPTLLRELSSHVSSPEKALKLEALATSEFQSQAHLFLPSNELAIISDTVTWWTVMQHHGAPTRLLDWTASIYVAAYFAVNQNPDGDGAIWLVHTRSLHTAMEKKYGDITIPVSEQAVRERFLDSNAPPAVTGFMRSRRSSRLVAQQGTFTISPAVLADHGKHIEAAIDSDGNQTLYAKLVVPAAQKNVFARKLRSMNITASSLFPGLDGLARSIGEFIRLRVSDAL